MANFTGEEFPGQKSLAADDADAPNDGSTKIQRALKALKGKANQAVESGFNALNDAGYPNAAVAAGTVGGTAAELLPEDEKDLALAAMPIPGGSSIRRGLGMAEKALAREAPRVLDYGAEKLAGNAAREASEATARTIDYGKMAADRRAAAAASEAAADTLDYTGRAGPTRFTAEDIRRLKGKRPSQ